MNDERKKKEANPFASPRTISKPERVDWTNDEPAISPITVVLGAFLSVIASGIVFFQTCHAFVSGRWNADSLLVIILGCIFSAILAGVCTYLGIMVVIQHLHRLFASRDRKR